MAKIKGPSGVVVDAPDTVASGLVNAGQAEYVKDEKPEPKEAKTSKSKK